MSNLRIIADNAIDRATLTASSSATNFPVTNLQLPRKSDVWRATGTSARLTASWASPETVQGVALPFCDLSPTATIRARATNETPNANLITYSQQMENSGVWSQTAVTVTSGTAAPDGTTSAVYLQDTTANSVHEIRTSMVSFTAGNYYTISAFLKAGTRNFAYIGLPTAGFSTSQYIIFDLTAGTAALTVGTPTSYSIQPVSGMPGWYRCSVTALATTTASGTCFLGMRAAAVAGPYVGDGNSWIYAWGCQVELGYMTSYYPTTSAPATRPLGYIDSWQSYSGDSGTVLACPAPASRPRGFTAAQAASAYAFGGGACARAWLSAPVQAYGLAVDIVDTGNLPGYIEASHLVAGAYWESATNFDYGASAQPIDTSKSSRNDAGDQITDIGTVSRHLKIPMSNLSPTDQTALWNIMLACGTHYPVFVSMFPGDSDLAREARHQVYGKFQELPEMSLPYFNLGASTLELESV
jgi:hypothetical protein